MKPIHHALVSTRLFGGAPEDYLKVHNAFDMSKAALPDMRHRAALHSVDHGYAIMSLIFPDCVGKTTLEKVCIQHVNDDQGFDTHLDHWLSECGVPGYAIGSKACPDSLQGFRQDPIQACIEKWGGTAADYANICQYYELPTKFSNHPMAPAVSLNSFSIYFSEMAFGQTLKIPRKDGRIKYVAVRDIGECIALATYGRILTLADVFETMSKKSWMMGSRVARSRKRRQAKAGRSDLFNESIKPDGLLTAAFLDEAAVSAILSD